MSEPVVIELGWIPPAAVRGNSRAHWARKSRIAQYLKTSGINQAVLNRLAFESQVRITFCFYHWRKIDLDNLAIGMKSFVDGLTLDDDPDRVIYGEHTFTKTAHKGESRTIVTIEELP